ncbi:MAG: 4,5-DOPA dioxygenase extradiol [Planctomycetaceae bacterium]
MVTSAGAVSLTSSLQAMSEELPEQDTIMPAFFIGHGSPMNAIEDNEFTRGWRKAMEGIPQPTAILCVSAHWLTRGTWVTALPKPRTIHDFGGFPRRLSEATYSAPGSPKIAQSIANSVSDVTIGLDQKWGLDHGAWSILMPVFPNANIPAMELSIDEHQSPIWHYELGQMLARLRRRGVLIIGSGNIVHNLGLMNPRLANSGYDWAEAFNETIKERLLKNDHRSIIDYTKLGREAQLAIPTSEHYLPLLYTLGLQTKADTVSIFNDQSVMGSITMTSVRIDSERRPASP